MIKTIVFDFGDVFINLDKTASERELRKTGFHAFTPEMELRNQAFEKGLVSPDDFIASYLKDFPGLSEEGFINSWNAVLKEFPQHRLDFLRGLCKQKNFRLALLSNTNDLHIDWVRQNVSFFEEFRDCFHAFYLSHEINMRKPDSCAFRYVLEDLGADPGETLFIDDTRENTDAASRLGFRTWNIDPAREDVAHLLLHQKELI